MKKFLLALALLLAGNASADPFGMRLGMSIEQVKKLGNFRQSANSPYLYSATKVANGHPDFELYTVALTPQHGLCKIRASSKDVVTSSYGNELSSKFQNLVAALTRKYGEPKNTHDFLRSGSIWNEPRDWMMGLLKQERTLAAFWIKPESSGLPAPIQTIGVDTHALSPSKGYVTISYEFSNFDKCIQVIESTTDSNL